MGRFFIKFFIFITAVLVSVIIFLSYVGLETNRFDNLIKNKTNDINKFVKLDFDKTKIYLHLKELDLLVKLQDPKVIIKNNEINLTKFDLFLSIKSFYSSDFLLKKANIGFEKNDIKDITKITGAFLPRILNKQLNKIFSQGTLEGEFTIPFDKNGNIAKGYGFSGKVLNAKIRLNKEFKITNLTTNINYSNQIENGEFKTKIIQGSLYDFDLKNSVITLLRKDNEIKVNGELYTNGKVNFSKVKKISSLLKIPTNNLKDIKGNTKLKTIINFNLSKKFKVKNLTYSTEGQIDNVEINIVENKIIKKFLPKYSSRLFLNKTKVKFKKLQKGHLTEINGLLKINDGFDNFNLVEKYNFDKKTFSVEGLVDLTNSEVKISNLNYSKNTKQKAELKFDFNFILENHYNIKKLEFSESKNKIYFSNLKINKNFQTENFEKIEIKTFSNGSKNNDFSAIKTKKIVVSGEVFDAQPLLKSLYKKNGKKLFSKKFNSDIKINFSKALTGTEDDVNSFAMIATITRGSFEKLSLKGNFSSEEIVEMSIYQVDQNKKTLQVISDRARPFIKNFDFIKGFEGGKLQYESYIEKEITNSNLVLTNFKVSKVPALAQLLTLASLQGIADTLSGEGIRFESFEMQSNSKNNLFNIDEALAMGPAVSILLDGYVDKGKVVSLRGTLVPATKLNSLIAKIPLVGDILVGKKTGEGVVGVSFKMKGPPKNIKTTVNPIKTLTPRFIVRAIEKMKKDKKEKAK